MIATIKMFMGLVLAIVGVAAFLAGYTKYGFVLEVDFWQGARQRRWHQMAKPLPLHCSRSVAIYRALVVDPLMLAHS